MPLSTNIAHYEDIRPHLDRALDSDKGVRITCENKGQAINTSQRLNKLRLLERERASEVFDVGDPRRGNGPYDLLTVRVEDNAILITHKVPLIIEEL